MVSVLPSATVITVALAIVTVLAGVKKSVAFVVVSCTVPVVLSVAVGI